MTYDRTVYIDASVVFHLSSRATDRLFVVDWQTAAAKWWETQSSHFEIYTSALTIEEAGEGDPKDAARQLEALGGIPRLEITDDVTALADVLIHRQAIPLEERNAAIHIAAAAVHNIAYLLTWRIRRLAYPETGPLFREVCEQQGYYSPVICNPYELTRGQMLPDEIFEELWEAKDAIAREHDYDIWKLGAHYRRREASVRYYAVPAGRNSMVATVFRALDRIEARPPENNYRIELEQYLKRMREVNLKGEPFDEPMPSPND